MRQELATLFHRRWALPVLDELHRTGGAKFATLRYRLGASDGAVRQTLDDLIDSGLIMRNPGYGHPLRPEYLLTKRGDAVAPACTAVLRVLDRRGLGDVGLRKWPLPVLHAVGAASSRYTEIRSRLPGVTDRALGGALRELQDVGLLTRTLIDARPPAVVYRPTARSRPLRSVLNDLASALQRAADPPTG